MAEAKKPKVKLSGTDGNVFALTVKCSQALRKAGVDPAAFQAEVQSSKSYDEALQVMMKHCDVQ